jgi:hypothetical protein
MLHGQQNTYEGDFELLMKDNVEFKYLRDNLILNFNTPIMLASRSKAWVCGHSIAGNVGSNTTGGIDVCLL